MFRQTPSYDVRVKRWKEHLKAASHSWEFWVAEVVCIPVVSTALGVVFGPWVAVAGGIFALLGVIGVIASSDLMAKGPKPERFALASGLCLLILAGGVMLGFWRGRDSMMGEVDLIGPRADVRVDPEGLSVVFDRSTLLVPVHNYGDRIASKGYVVLDRAMDESSNRFIGEFQELAPGEKRNLQLPVWSDVADVSRVVKEAPVTIAVTGCYSYEGRDYFMGTLQATLYPLQRRVSVGHMDSSRHLTSCVDRRRGDTVVVGADRTEISIP